MKMLRSFSRQIEGFSFGGGKDGLMWHKDLKAETSGDFSIAAMQANYTLEDQGQVMNSQFGTYIGVYDGHCGHEAARFINNHLFVYIERYALEQGGMCAEVLEKAISAIEEEFLNLVKRTWPARPNITSVGSCCLVGVISNNMLYVANLGGSSAILGSSCRTDRSVDAEILSTSHKACMKEVQKELKALHPDDSEIVVQKHGVWRVKGFIQMSRSIGDIHLKDPEFSRQTAFSRMPRLRVEIQRPVLTAKPSINVRLLKPQDRFLIFASDGLWEFVSEREAVEIVHKNPRKGIAKRLVTAALMEATRLREMRYKHLKKIERGIRRHFHDDMTVIVVFLDHELLKMQSKLHRKFKSGLDCTSVPLEIYKGVDESP